MSLARYGGTYSDSRGRDVIEFLNDSETLRVTIRGVAFGPNLAPASCAGAAPRLLGVRFDDRFGSIASQSQFSTFGSFYLQDSPRKHKCWIGTPVP
jgi:hypothetical protein